MGGNPQVRAGEHMGMKLQAITKSTLRGRRKPYSGLYVMGYISTTHATERTTGPHVRAPDGLLNAD